MQPQRYGSIAVLLNYPTLTLLVIVQLQMGNLRQYTLLIKKFQFRLLGLHSMYTGQKILLATISEGYFFPLSLFFVTCLSTNETLHL